MPPNHPCIVLKSVSHTLMRAVARFKPSAADKPESYVIA